ncbi:MAG: sialate O-acetylesterase [Planctomycetes bacterium]|nr:sialate O-acetylesterase [Planctomycetota bacterium]
MTVCRRSYHRACRAVIIAGWLAMPAVSSAMSPPPRIFGDNMVLQRERPIPVWGKGQAGEEITVRLAGTEAKTKSDATGKWMVRLPALSAGGPHTLTISGKDDKSVAYKNVMVGEVWICSGQSNMAWPLSRANDADKEIAAAKHPDIRLFTVKTKTSPTPLADVESDGWQVCGPETAPRFSAVGYFFGRELYTKLNVPIGLVNTSWGGTAIEPWTPPLGFVLVPAVQQFYDEIERADRDYAAQLETYVTQRREWVTAAKEASPAGKDVTMRPPLPPEHRLASAGSRQPSGIYNAMVDPLVPYAIAGAIWYQGEANCVGGDGMVYHEKMKALIAGWRAVWGQGGFPFLYVQLAPWEYKDKYPGPEDRLPRIWEAQTATLSVPNTGMAVTTDIGDIHDIHPKNKQEVGRRLALWAVAKSYGKTDLVCSGPLYKSMAIEGSKVRVRFDCVGGGLASRDGQPLSWFQIAGEDRKFVDATAAIDGDAVVVSSDRVAKPVGVRCGWNELAEPNLMNKEGLPVSPFRTDKW